MRTVFFGTPEFAAVALEALVASEHVVTGVVCQPDKPAGRGRHLAAPPVKAAALRAGLPLAQPNSVRTTTILDTVRAWAPDVVIVAAYGKILPPALLTLPPLGCINIHASLLPHYRGAAPIHWAIARGEAVTGITIMQMDAGMDTGDILLQRETPIDAVDTGQTLHDRLARLGADAVLAALAGLERGTLTRTPQDPSRATLAPLLRKDDGRIDWAHAAVDLERLVRAFDPWPSAFTFIGGKRLRVLRARVSAAEPGTSQAAPGTVLATGAAIAVATGSGVLLLDAVQLEGRKRLSAAEFVRGGGVATETRLG